MKKFSQILNDYIQELLNTGLYRRRLGEAVFQNNKLSSKFHINFSSNDYLSLSNDQAVKTAFQHGFKKYPTSSSGSIVVSGYHKIHRDFEQMFAKALNCDDALLFSSGYAANLSVSLLLAKFAEQIIIDKAIHASFYDGLKLSGANYLRFLANNPKDLHKKILKLHAAIKTIAIITESVFSMSGQIALLKEMAAIAAGVGDLIVDEAHAFGVFGPSGFGLCPELGLTQQEVPLRIVPFGKAFAHQGAIVVGKGEWIDALLQCGRSIIYSTAISPALVYGLMETFTIIQKADDRRKKLAELINYFREAVKQTSFIWGDSKTPIQQLQLGCPHKALQYTNYLAEHEIFCQAIRSPTVSNKATGLRIILNYQHTNEDIDHLLKLLCEINSK